MAQSGASDRDDGNTDDEFDRAGRPAGDGAGDGVRGGSGGLGDPFGAFGRYLRAQRQLAQLSLRQLAELTRVSNPYLSQIERGLHQPSVAVIKSLARALNLSVEDLLAQAAGVAADDGTAGSTEAAIRSDPLLDQSQKGALLAVYRSMIETSGRPGTEGGTVPGR